MINLLLLLSACQDYDINAKDGQFHDESPSIVASPESLYFDYLEAGQSAVQTVTYKNVGQATLTLADLHIRQGGNFTVTSLETEMLLIDEETTVSVTWNSTGENEENALLIDSNDPVNETLVVPINTGNLVIDTGDTGDSGIVVVPTTHNPVAVCSVEPAEVEAIHGSADWIGHESYDEDGEEITNYIWTLYSSPAGSIVTMPFGTADRLAFVPDMVGEYVGELIVKNSIGEFSEPCYTTLTATASGDLWIETFWTHSGDDMDLHLVRPSGALVTNSDCYYANCTTRGLDWGVSGDRDDDPILDLDDIPGVGPENINIDSPENGTFTVYVHDYPGSVYSGRNDVTVNVYVGGYLEWTDTANINSENLYEPICEIDWYGSTATVTGI